jgi:hypothetical protein
MPSLWMMGGHKLITLGKFLIAHIFVLWVLVSKHGHIFYYTFMLPSYVLGVLRVLESSLEQGYVLLVFVSGHITRCCCM